LPYLYYSTFSSLKDYFRRPENIAKSYFPLFSRNALSYVLRSLASPSSMHVSLRLPQPDDSELHPSWRHREGVSYTFNSAYAAKLIEEFNRTNDPAVADELLQHSETLIRQLFRYRQTVRHVEIDELLTLTRIKLWKSVRHDPDKGTAFSFVARVASSVGVTAVQAAWRRYKEAIELDETVELLPVNTPDRPPGARSSVQSRIHRPTGYSGVAQVERL
jgi:hypothetical protein